MSDFIGDWHALLVLLVAGVIPNQIWRMLGLWFAYTVAVSLFAAYLGSRSLPAAADGIVVFRLVATVAFLAYAGGAVPNGIWMGKPWRSVAKELLDGLIYAAATGAAFACLWPH